MRPFQPRGKASFPVALLLAPSLLLLLYGCAGSESNPAGQWHAWLDSPGGPLPFELVIEGDGDSWAGWVVNGKERLVVPRIVVDGREVGLYFDHYDSVIGARLDHGAESMAGDWRRTAGPDTQAHLVFHAARGVRPRFDATATAGEPSDVAGRWAVAFETNEDPSVGIFEAGADGIVTGTFLNTTGDHRFLAGDYRAGLLRLSVFDGSHAFLFHARVEGDTMRGDFWSRDTWHETWTARRDDDAALPDAFALTHVDEATALGDLAFPDLDGTPRRLDDEAFAGKARLLVVFGTWCPNCGDATDYLVELERRYGGRGLSILGLAFEMTGDFERDAEQVRKYSAFKGVDYPILVAGLSDKDRASEQLPLLDRVRSYPTIVFIDRDGAVRAVHQGFSGPATGVAYVELRERFEALIEEMLG